MYNLYDFKYNVQYYRKIEMIIIILLCLMYSKTFFFIFFFPSRDMYEKISI